MSTNTQHTMAFILNQILAERQLSQRELSRISGITQAQLSKICAGTQSPSLTTIERIADALKVDVVDLFESEKVHRLRCPFCRNEVTVKIDTQSHIKIIH